MKLPSLRAITSPRQYVDDFYMPYNSGDFYCGTSNGGGVSFNDRDLLHYQDALSHGFEDVEW